MPDLELIDRLVATYRILNHTVRLKSEAELAQGGNSPKTILRQLRDDELRFSPRAEGTPFPANRSRSPRALMRPA